MLANFFGAAVAAFAFKFANGPDTAD
jgi:hypothetical protein